MAGSILGSAVKRVEDPRFITGEGRYLPNMVVDGALFLAAVRSPAAHGRIIAIDVESAAAMPGVVGVFTADDLDLDTIPPGTEEVPEICARPPLARDVVRFAGETVAVVVAETHRQALEAAGLVWVDLDPLPVVPSVDAALAEGAPLLFPELGTNVVLESGSDPIADLFADADVVVAETFVNQRLAAVPMEPNSALAIPTEEGLTLWVGSQNVFGHRRNVARLLGLDAAQIHGRVPDMGGGFGAKFYTYPEQALVAALALRLQRPVRWHETRTENLAGMYHGRAQRQHVELGARRDGSLVGLRATVYQDAGAYPTMGAVLPTFTHRMAGGPYRLPRVEFHVVSVATNTTPTHAYRGAGRPEATALLERAMDLLAAELEMDPAELRRRNFIPPDEFPFTSATGARYDSGDFAAALDRALDIAGYEGLRAEQAARRRAGHRVQLGIGISTYVEVTASVGPKEWGSVEVHEDGTVTVACGTSAHGQGHETAYAQIVAELLHIPHTDVRVVQGDTARVARGQGTGGSRSLQLGGSAVLRAGTEVLDKATRIVAHLVEASPDDITVFADGRIGVAGVPGSGFTWGELAAAAASAEALPAGMEPGLAAEVIFDQGEPSYPFGAHVSVVEVDTESGDVAARRHVAVDDCGTILNRLLVDGQVHGGIAQGAAQALLEQVLYDEDGNPQTANLTTYLLPVAAQFPAFEVDHTETATPLNPLGAKGIGEAATIGSTPAVQNAVVDALAHLGVTHLDMPATPQRVWEAIRRATGT